MPLVAVNQQYADAHARWEAHKTQVEQAAKDDAEASASGDNPSSYSSDSSASSSAAPASEGTLASDEALAALREKLTGN